MLVNCDECGKEISNQARICPNCGAKTQKVRKRNNYIKFSIIILITIILIITFGLFEMTNNDLYKYRKQAITILENYKEDKITQENARENLKSLCSTISSTYNKVKDNDDTLYLAHLSNLSAHLDSYSWDILKNGKSNIDEHINKLKTELFK